MHKTCELALQSDIPYAWVDTCCIDKSSSAELTEAINSTYNYYRRSEICYAYIDGWVPGQDWSDLAALGAETQTSESPPTEQDKATGAFAAKHAPLRWFTRGWTLQELIAPDKVQFYDAAWLPRGFKNDKEVTPRLSRTTGIASRILNDGSEASLHNICLDQRMSWAAYRETSRVEDIAYCLMGIFQVNMALLYGEGDRAFLRFQQEIIKNTTDLSIIAWQPRDGYAFAGAFSSHPRQFAGLTTCELSRSQFSRESEITITNRGLRIHAAPFEQRRERADSWQLLYIDLGSTKRVAGVTNSCFLILYPRPKDVYSRYCYASAKDVDLRSMVRAKAQALYIMQDDDSAGIPSRHNQNDLSIYISIPGEFGEKGTEGRPYRLQSSGSWPPSHAYRQLTVNLSDVYITNLAWFTGFVKLNIAAKTHDVDDEQEPEIIDDLVMVYSGSDCGCQVEVTAGLLRRNSALEFIDSVGRAEQLHPQIAQETLYGHVVALRENGVLVKHVKVQDTVRKKELRISVSIEYPDGARDRELEITLDEIRTVR